MSSNLRTIQPAQRRHVDGSVCLEGTRTLPRGFTACCKDFEARTSACVHDVRYEWNETNLSWQIAISPAAGGGGLGIKFCPHCGTSLTPR